MIVFSGYIYLLKYDREIGMKNIVHFYPIVIPEKTKYQQYLYLNHEKDIELRYAKLLFRIIDEIELFEVKNNKFYKNNEDLKNDKELEESVILYPDDISGMYREITIIKQLGWEETIDGIYEIRLDSSSYVYRVIIFPFVKEKSTTNHSIVTLTYAFDKLHTHDGNRITSELRDSSYRIKQIFNDEIEMIKYLNIDEGDV